jgi:hypothetical protein
LAPGAGTLRVGSGYQLKEEPTLRHGVLSRYTVLPWENGDEYHALVTALVAGHVPQGPTEGIWLRNWPAYMWRKRRLRLAGTAAHRRGLDGTLASYRETVKVARVHLDATSQSERVVDAILSRFRRFDQRVGFAILCWLRFAMVGHGRQISDGGKRRTAFGFGRAREVA